MLDVTVTRVVDGDTLDVAAADGSQDRIRLLGVDTPEIRGPNKPNEYGDITDIACLDDWGIRAEEFAAEKLEGRVVTLVIDGTTFGELFTFGRLLAFVELDGVDFNRLLLELGLARAYTEASNGRAQEYLEIQQQAQASKTGLWACQGGASTPIPSALSIQTATPALITQAAPGPSPTPATLFTPHPSTGTHYNAHFSTNRYSNAGSIAHSYSNAEPHTNGDPSPHRYPNAGSDAGAYTNTDSPA